MKMFSNRMKYVSKLALMLVSPLLFACDKEESSSFDKGATTELMKGMAANVELIQSVQKDSLYDFCEGVKILDAQFTYCQKPTRMWVAIVDLTKNVTLATCTPDNKDVQSSCQKMTLQAQKAEEAGKKVLIGINGDYFGWDGKNQYKSQGIFYKDGKAIKSTVEPQFNSMVSVEKNGEVKIATFAEFQMYKDNVQHAIGGWQRMLEDGVPGWFEVNDNAMQFHPRTFVGLTKDQKTFYMFVIDGRRSEHSNGMRIEDMIKLCQGAGLYQALNLDGGGSSTFLTRKEVDGVVSFDILNKPSDNTEREVVNGLLVIQKN